MKTLRPTDNEAELTNPGMGWALHYYDNVPRNYGSKLEPSDLLPDWPGLSFIYLRIPWAYVEPEQGVFDWSVVDTPMQRFAERGLQACFRFSCSESWMEYPTPKWVLEAGAGGYRFRPGKGIVKDGPFWEPDFDDPVFLEKLEAFLIAAARRYDGHPDVAFIDIGSFGVWGEGHTWASTRKAYPNSTIMRHIDLHLKHFRKTPIVGMDDYLSRPQTRPGWETGWNDRTFDVVIPMEWRNREYVLATGLWQRGRNEHRGRLTPYRGTPERRAALGRLRIAENGQTTFAAADGQLPDAGDDLGGAEFAAVCPGIRHDVVNQPHSLKVPVRYLLNSELSPNTEPFLHLLDADPGKEVFAFREEREDEELTDYMAGHGLGLRDDSILVQGRGAAYFHAEMAQKFWRRAPVVIESEHYGGSAGRGCWGDGSGFLQSIEDYHASYASIHWWPHEFLEKNRDLVRQINLRIGYRFRLAEIAWSESVTLEDVFSVRWAWQNTGVAPPYTDYFPTLTLKDANDGIAAVWVDDRLDLRDLPIDLRDPQARVAERTFRLPFQLRSGEYSVFVSVGDTLGKPVVALPLDGDDGHRRYRIGSCAVTGDYAVVVTATHLRDGKLDLRLRWRVHSDPGETAEAFFHIDRGGKLHWAGGLPDDSPARAEFTTSGVVETSVSIPLPELARGEAVHVLGGLWRPDRIGHDDERCIPDKGQSDRRVLLGRIVCGEDGAVSFGEH